MIKWQSKSWIFGLIIILFVCGCVSLPEEDETIKDDSGKVYISGDITTEVLERKGF